MTDKELFKLALKAKDKAYAPFSKFGVGAALLSEDGEVFLGVNVENSSYGATICAERSAFVQAVSKGVRAFSKIAVATSQGEAWPCGICRQFMKEFCDDSFEIISGSDEEHLVTHTLLELLPLGFKLDDECNQIKGKV